MDINQNRSQEELFHTENVENRVGLLVGDLALSKREDELSEQMAEVPEP